MITNGLPQNFTILAKISFLRYILFFIYKILKSSIIKRKKRKEKHFNNLFKEFAIH